MNTAQSIALHDSLTLPGLPNVGGVTFTTTIITVTTSLVRPVVFA